MKKILIGLSILLSSLQPAYSMSQAKEDYLIHVAETSQYSNDREWALAELVKDGTEEDRGMYRTALVMLLLEGKHFHQAANVVRQSTEAFANDYDVPEILDEATLPGAKVYTDFSLEEASLLSEKDLMRVTLSLAFGVPVVLDCVK